MHITRKNMEWINSVAIFIEHRLDDKRFAEKAYHEIIENIHKNLVRILIDNCHVPRGTTRLVTTYNLTNHQ